MKYFKIAILIFAHSVLFPQTVGKTESSVFGYSDNGIPNCYRSDRVDKLMKKSSTDDLNRQLPKEKTRSFNAKEKLAYFLFYPDSYTQSCSLTPYDRDEDKKIHRSFPPIMEGFIHSQEQYKILKSQRDSIVLIINSSLGKVHKTLPSELAKAMLSLQAYECIPGLKECLKAKEDTYIYTLMILLMVEDRYEPFKETSVYKKLYDPKANAYSTILLNEKNSAMILQSTDAYYNLKKQRK